MKEKLIWTLWVFVSRIQNLLQKELICFTLHKGGYQYEFHSFMLSHNLSFLPSSTISLVFLQKHILGLITIITSRPKREDQ